jgi:hypothetical protein
MALPVAGVEFCSSTRTHRELAKEVWRHVPTFVHLPEPYEMRIPLASYQFWRVRLRTADRRGQLEATRSLTSLPSTVDTVLSSPMF